MNDIFESEVEQKDGLISNFSSELHFNGENSKSHVEKRNGFFDNFEPSVPLFNY
jgi:hypothetical protein